MDPDGESEYERRLRDKHPDKMWWEDLRGHKILWALVVIAVIAMIVVGYLVK